MNENFQLEIIRSGDTRPEQEDLLKLIEQISKIAAQSSYAPAELHLRQFIDDIFSASSCFSEKKIMVALFSPEKMLAGFCQVRFFLENADLDFIIVEHSFQRQGLAKIMTVALEHELKSCGVSRILLEVGKRNVAAHQLYISIGFVQIAVRQSYYRSGDDALVMEKRI